MACVTPYERRRYRICACGQVMFRGSRSCRQCATGRKSVPAVLAALQREYDHYWPSWAAECQRRQQDAVYGRRVLARVCRSGHLFATNARPGDPCVCGAAQKVCP